MKNFLLLFFSVSFVLLANGCAIDKNRNNDASVLLEPTKDTADAPVVGTYLSSTSTLESEEIKSGSYEELMAEADDGDNLAIQYFKYQDHYYSKIVGEPVIKDIDGDGLIEKIVRYNSLMADRSIQTLYIYRKNNEEYKLIATFEGDPYGFAKMVDNKTIVVGKFVVINDGIRGWDDFDEFQVTKYKWTKNGATQISQSVIKANTFDELDDSIKKSFD